MWPLGRLPALDGLRGMAILLVLACHAIPGWYATGGREGVAVFFALSGFLITSQLLERDHVGFGGFYARRARRLLPALVAFLASMVAAGLLFGAWLATPTETVPPLFYVQNFAVMNGLPTGGLTHLWSLAIEEQFYLLWPLVVAPLVSRRRALAMLAAGALVVSLGLRAVLLLTGADPLRTYVAPDTNACLLLVGCLLAVHLRDHRAPTIHPGVASAAVGGIVVLGFAPDGPMTVALAPVAAVALAVPGILAASSWSTPSWLRLIGRRSYALYLWHYPLVFLVPQHLPVATWVSVPVMIAASWGITLVSWRYVERPFMRKRYVAETVSAPAATVIVAAVTEDDSAPFMPFVPALAADHVEK